MKRSMELVLGAVLLALLYEKPHALTEFANSLLGKAVLIVIVGIAAKTRGLLAGLLCALIVISLMHENIEGMAVAATIDEKSEDSILSQLNDKNVKKMLIVALPQQNVKQ